MYAGAEYKPLVMTPGDELADGGASIGARSRALKLTQGLIPLGRNVLPLLPERPSRFVMAEVLGRWPQLWGLSAKGERVRGARRGFELAFPEEDVDALLANWVLERGGGMATSLSYLSRWIRGRRSRLVQPSPEQRFPRGPSVVAFLHYSIDPVVQLACISAAEEDLDIRWPTYPMQSGVEDDRELWLAGNTIPPRIAETLLPITDPSWVAVACGHLREGGTVFVSIDAPFDANKRARSSISIGRARLPMSPSVELFSKIEGVQLALAWPRPEGRSSWVFDLKPADGVDELAQLASAWIESHHQHWAGWPYLVWREKAMAMRENVMSLE